MEKTIVILGISTLEFTSCKATLLKSSLVNFLHIFRTSFFSPSGGLLLYPATSLKERTPALKRHLFCRIPPGNCYYSTEKYFTNKIVKDTPRKEKLLMWKTATHAKQKLNYYLHQVFLSFYYSKIFTASHDILKTQVFRKNVIPLRNIENYFSPSVWKK